MKMFQGGNYSLVSKIAKNGMKPQYLMLLQSVTYVGDKNIVVNQFEVIKILTNPSKFQGKEVHL